MPVMIRLMRAGAKKRPFYRVVAADSRVQRDGRFLEILGHYNPISQPFEIVVHKDRVEKWISQGAQPTEQAASLLKSLGISLRAPKTAAKKVVTKAKRAKGTPRRKPRALSARRAKKVTAKRVAKAAKKKAAKAAT